MIFLPFFDRSGLMNGKLLLLSFFHSQMGVQLPSRNIWSCLELCHVCLWESVFKARALEGFFFLSGGEFWIFLCHGSPAGSHFLPTWVTYKPAVISLQISNTARSKYIYVPFVCFFFSSQDLEWKSLSCCHLPSWTPVRAEAFPPLLISWKDNSEFWISLSLYLQWFRFPACHHGHASSYFLSSSWQTKSIVDAAVYRDAASVRDQQN